MKKVFKFFIAIILLFSFSSESFSLVIYSQRSNDLIDNFINEFSKKTAIETQVLYVSDGLLSRIIAEGSSSADVVLTSDLLILSDLKARGLSMPIESSIANKYISQNFKDKDNYWFGLTARARIIYAAKSVKDNYIPKSLEDLADKKYYKNICIRSGLHPYNITLFSAYAYHHGLDKLKDYLIALKKNLARRPQGNDRSQAKAIWQKECTIALGNSYYLGLMKNDAKQKRWFDSLNPVFVGFKDKGVHINISGFAVLKSSKKVDEAKKLLNFLLSEDIQKRYSGANFEYPIREDIEATDEVKSFSNNKAITRDTFDLDKMKGLRSKVIQIISEINFDS